MRKVLVLFKKEFKETIRDKSVIISNFVIPLLSLPLFIVIVSLATTVASIQDSKRVYKVAFTEDVPLDFIENISKIEKTSFIKAPEELSKFTFKQIKEVNKKELVKKLNKNKIDVLLLTKKKKDNIELFLFTDYSSRKSTRITKIVNGEVLKYSKKLLEQRLKKRSISSELLKPIFIQEINLSTFSKMTGRTVGAQAGVYLVILLILGMYYPTINAFMGEKEKKTLSVLMLASKNEFTIVFSKFLNIFLFGLLAIVPYLLEYLIFKFAFGKFIGSTIAGPSWPLGKFLMVILNLGVIGLLVSTGCMIVTLLSNSMTRAQSMMSGFMIVLSIPLILVSVLDLELNAQVAMIPFMNFFMLVKSLLVGDLSYSLGLLCIFSNLFFTLILFNVCLSIFRRKNVLIQ